MAIITIAKNCVNAKLVDAPSEVKDTVSNLLSYVVAGAEHSDAFKCGRWDGRSTFFKYRSSSFPAGFVRSVVQTLKKSGHKVRIVEKDRPKPLGHIRPNINAFGYTDEYSYQPETIDRLVERGGMIAQLATGCHIAGTKILMFDGSLKNVEDIVVGDVLMGPDSLPRNVMSLHRGVDEMFKIVPHRYGDPFIVNGGHILSLEQTSLPNCRPESINNGRWVETSVYDYLNWSTNQKHIHKLHRSRGVDFQHDNCSLPIEPYMLGLLLGDGYLKSNSAPTITSADSEIAAYLQDYCDRHVMYLNSNEKKGTLARSYVLASYKKGEGWSHLPNGRANPLRAALNSLGLTGHKSDTKFIPDMYKFGSRETRLSILAGLIDTDGHLHNGGYDFVSKSSSLANDFAFISRSLGFGVSVYTKTINSGVYAGNTYTRVHIAGEASQIPVLIDRKKADVRRQKKDVCLSGFTVERVGDGEYFGFEVDEDNLYLMGDFTVTHNSGKSNVAAMAIARIKRPALFITTRGVLMYQMERALDESFAYRALNGEPELAGFETGVIGDGIWQPKKITVAMVQTLAAKLKDPDPFSHPADQRKQKAIQDKVKQLLSRYELVILEEAHEASGESYYTILQHCVNAHYRLALTATPFMKDNVEDNMRLMASVGPIGIKVTERELIDKGILAKPYFKYIDNPPNPKVKNGTTWQRAYKLGIVECPHRNALIVKEALKMKEAGLSVITLVQQTAHGDKLKQLMSKAGLKVMYIRGESTQEQRQAALNKLGAGKIDVLIGTVILDVGVDVPSVGGIILAGGGKAEVALRQRIGRGLRRKKTGANVAFIVDFKDRHNSHLRSHAAQRRAIVESTDGFSENILSDGKEFDFSILQSKKVV